MQAYVEVEGLRKWLSSKAILWETEAQRQDPLLFTLPPEEVALLNQSKNKNQPNKQTHLGNKVVTKRTFLSSPLLSSPLLSSPLLSSPLLSSPFCDSPYLYSLPTSTPDKDHTPSVAEQESAGGQAS
jgi:hypothetical protein